MPERLKSTRDPPGTCVRWRWSPDRKSTRLNSSHQIISYAVFCLKKKKITAQRDFKNGKCARRSFSPDANRKLWRDDSWLVCWSYSSIPARGQRSHHMRMNNISEE